MIAARFSSAKRAIFTFVALMIAAGLGASQPVDISESSRAAMNFTNQKTRRRDES